MKIIRTTFRTLLVVALISQSSCITSRLAQPGISGFIFDADTKLPVAGCAVMYPCALDSSKEDNRITMKVSQGKYSFQSTIRIKQLSVECDNKCHHILAHIDQDGLYDLKEIRYLEFTLPGMEAPPLFVMIGFCKKGYEGKVIEYKSLFGGGGGRGINWEIEPIFLKKQGLSYKED